MYVSGGDISLWTSLIQSTRSYQEPTNLVVNIITCLESDYVVMNIINVVASEFCMYMLLESWSLAVSTIIKTSWKTGVAYSRITVHTVFCKLCVCHCVCCNCTCQCTLNGSSTLVFVLCKYLFNVGPCQRKPPWHKCDMTILGCELEPEIQLEWALKRLHADVTCTLCCTVVHRS